MPFFEEQENGKICLEGGDYESAMEHFDNAYKLASTGNEIASVCTYMGDTYFEQGEYDLAIEKYSAAAEAGDNELTERALLSRGNAKIKKGNFQDAIDDFKRARKYAPQFLQAYFNEGDAYFQTGAQESAFICYQMAIDNADEKQKGIAYVHRAYKFDAIKEKEKAEEDIMKANQISEQEFISEIELSLMFAGSYFKNAQFDEAKIAYEALATKCDQIVKKYKDDKMGTFYSSNNEDELYFNIQRTKMKILEQCGDGYQQNGMNKQAVECYYKAEKVSQKLSQDVFGNFDDCFQLLTKKGEVLLDLKEPEQALQSFENASKFQRTNLQKMNRISGIADCHVQLKQTDKAIEEYTEGMKIVDTEMTRQIQKIVDIMPKANGDMFKQIEIDNQIKNTQNIIQNKSIIAGDKALLLAKRGSAYCKNSQFEQGQADFDQLKDFDVLEPTKIKCFQIYAKALKNEGDKIFSQDKTSEKAFQLFQKAAEVAPMQTKFNFHFHAAQCRGENFQFEQAIQQCKIAELVGQTRDEIKVATAEELRFQGDIMFENKQDDKAFPLYEQAIQKAPSQWKTKLCTHSAVQRFRLGEFQKGLRQFQKASDQFQQGFDKCAEALQFAENDKDRAMVLTEMSWGHYQQQDDAKAKEECQMAFQLENTENRKEQLNVIELTQDTKMYNEQVIEMVKATFEGAKDIPVEEINYDVMTKTFDNGKKTVQIPKVNVKFRKEDTMQ